MLANFKKKKERDEIQVEGALGTLERFRLEKGVMLSTHSYMKKNWDNEGVKKTDSGRKRVTKKFFLEKLKGRKTSLENQRRLINQEKNIMKKNDYKKKSKEKKTKGNRKRRNSDIDIDKDGYLTYFGDEDNKKVKFKRKSTVEISEDINKRKLTRAALQVFNRRNSIEKRINSPPSIGYKDLRMRRDKVRGRLKSKSRGFVIKRSDRLSQTLGEGNFGTEYKMRSFY